MADGTAAGQGTRAPYLTPDPSDIFESLKRE
jgi:hypothetical protein